MAKTDPKSTLIELYKPPKEPVLVNVPAMNFLMIDGTGDPNTSVAYQQAIEALYGLSYTLKFMIKKETGADHKVSPLEGLWWVDDLAQLSMERKDNWKWTAMLVQPETVTETYLERATVELKRRKDPAALGRVRFERFEEGLSAQLLHVGPYSAEGPNIQRLHAFVGEQGYRLRGKHHEIYLSDPRRAAPEKLKTIIRHPVEML